MLYKKRGFFAFVISLLVHSLILVFFFLTLNKTIIHADSKTVIYLRTVKIEKHKPYSQKIVKKQNKQKIKEKPKTKPTLQPTPKLKQIIKPKRIKKPKLKHVKKRKLKSKNKKIAKHIRKMFSRTRSKPKQIYKPIESYKKIVSQVSKTKKYIRKQAPILCEQKENIKKKYLRLNFDRILQAINETKFYPRKARMLDIEGSVKVAFTLKKDGKIANIKALTNKRFLKDAAIEIVKNASDKFPKPPKDIRIMITITFTLDG